jgi:hypothetical protein
MAESTVHFSMMHPMNTSTAASVIKYGNEQYQNGYYDGVINGFCYGGIITIVTITLIAIVDKK